MAFSYSTFFNRLGNLFGIAKLQINQRASIRTRMNNMDAYYDAASRYMISQVISYYSSLGTTQDTSVTQSISGGLKTLTEMISANNTNIAKTKIAALTELNQIMITDGISIPINTISQGAAAYVSVGNGKVVIHGEFPQLSPNETIQFLCISDITTGSPSGRESFTVTGAARIKDVTSDLYPQGSGGNATYSSIDYATGNYITNGTFDSWTAGLPNNWSFVYGSANVSQYVAGSFRGSSSLQITSNSATSLYQTASTQILGPHKRITFGFWAKKISGTLVSVVSMQLTDQTNSPLANCSATSATLTTDWKLFTGYYISPYGAPPTTVTVQLSNQNTNGVEVAIDCVFIDEPQQLGINGQFITICAGSIDWRLKDAASVVMTNNLTSNLLNYFERFFSAAENGIELPVNASPTYTDAVIP